MLRILPTESPCRAVPWAALPVGAKALCVLAAALWRLRRREGR
jgi:hypothetical protein